MNKQAFIIEYYLLKQLTPYTVTRTKNKVILSVFSDSSLVPFITTTPSPISVFSIIALFVVIVTALPSYCFAVNPPRPIPGCLLRVLSVFPIPLMTPAIAESAK